MKKISTILMLFGLISLVLGIYGFIQVASTGLDVGLVNLGTDIIQQFNLAKNASFSQKFTLMVMGNRMLLTLVGMIGLFAGGLLRKIFK